MLIFAPKQISVFVYAPKLVCALVCEYYYFFYNDNEWYISINIGSVLLLHTTSTLLSGSLIKGVIRKCASEAIRNSITVCYYVLLTRLVRI